MTSTGLLSAHISQLNRAQEADDWQIVPDYNSIVKDLQAVDKGLNVRFSKRGQCWAVYHRNHDDCPHNAAGHSRDSTVDYLIRTMPARLSPLGIWTGLDERVVTRMLQIMPDGRWGYNTADELEKARKAREARQRHEFRERIGEQGEKIADALRRDLGLGPYRSRMFVPRDVASDGRKAARKGDH